MRARSAATLRRSTRIARASTAVITIAIASILAPPAPPARAAAENTDGVWTALPFPPPSPRTRHSAIYDPVRNRMLVFGGLASSGRKNDVWELALSPSATWKLLTPSGTPPSPRFGQSAIYDPVRDRMLVFGGDAGSPQSDVWALSMTSTPTWTQLAPTGSPPEARSGQAAVYDPVRDRLLVIAGDDAGVFLGDVWALSLSGTPSWSQITPTGTPPSARSRHTAIYDSVRDRVVLFGGVDDAGSWNDTWSLSLPGIPSWTHLLPTGTPPLERFGHTAIYDPVRDAMVVYGGNDGGDTPSGGTWRLAFSPSLAWTQLAPSGTAPQGRTDHVAIYDSALSRMLVFGGMTELPVNDLASLTLSGGTTWATLSTLGVPPSPRNGHTATYDPVRDRMLVFGGSGSQIQQDTWALNLNGATWTKLAPGGSPPAARYGHVAVYDPIRDRLLVFGGLGNSGYLDDTWALSLSGPGSPAWTQLSTSGGPPAPRYASAGVYDPVNDRLVIFGGYDFDKLGDVWSLSLAGTPTWTQLSPSGAPPAARFLHDAVLLPSTNQMLIFGGTDSSLFNDAWTLDLSGPPAWTALAPSGAPPVPRYGSSAVYDAARQRVVVFGGFDGFFNRGDTWSLSLGGGGAWSLLAPTGSSPTPRSGHAAVYDVASDRMLLYGGLDSQLRDDTSELAWGTETGIVETPRPPRASAALRPAFPNPFRTATTFAYELPASRQGRIAIYDVRGRLVRQMASGALAPGSRYVRWDGVDDQGRTVASGAYFCRLELSDAKITRKVVYVR